MCGIDSSYEMTRIQANFPPKTHDGAYTESWTCILIYGYLVLNLIHASAHYGAQLEAIGNHTLS